MTKKSIVGIIVALFITTSSASALSPQPEKPIPPELFVPVEIMTLPTPVPKIAPHDVIKNLPVASPYVYNPIQVQVKARTYAPTVADAKAYARNQLGSTQFNCIDLVFQRESKWNPFARNRYSGAYGIPQALPGSKMATYGADWKTNPVTQVKWGINYVNARYGSACGAWKHSQVYGWY